MNRLKLALFAFIAVVLFFVLVELGLWAVGVATLLSGVPVGLAATHQAGGLILLSLLIHAADVANRVPRRP